jgi:hypothetical protein
LIIVLVMSILLLVSGYRLDKAQTLALFGKQLEELDFRFDSHIQNLIKTIGLDTEGVLLEWTEINNSTR